MIKNSNVLITGASSGIGEALAIYYAKNGAANLFLSGRNEERLENVKAKCENFNTNVYTQIVDVTNSDDVKNWINEANNTATLNIVIANAGVSTGEESESNVRNTVQTNVNGVVNTILPTIDLYKKRTAQNNNDKHLVLISSIAGYHGL